MSTRPAWWTARAALRRVALDLAIDRLRASLGMFPGVRGALVFGRYARGDVGPESDLDLIIVRDIEAVRADRDDDIRRVLRLGVPYDLVTLTPEQFERRPGERPFYARARAEGFWIDAARAG